ncbi:uncharacterized protein TrAFT101_002663 [Trichoderma asperellum]|uniref:uncharacterized protein n=1 Tax=Trichoderma asperellum TaxID=101201 RepID=UPI003317727B|nr:hypothetical protein TrAFT101_002663 [Trichoderma asperellum]
MQGGTVAARASLRRSLGGSIRAWQGDADTIQPCCWFMRPIRLLPWLMAPAIASTFQTYRPPQAMATYAIFNTGQSFMIVTPSCRATRLLFANCFACYYSIVAPTVSQVISSS